MIRLALILLIAGSLFADGRRDGRRGNQAYAEGNFEAAAEAYQQGLSTLGDRPDPRIPFGLLNNLGASQYRMEHPQEALEAFEAAASQAVQPDDRALAAYNAGNAAFRAEDLQRAVAHYRKALLDNPSDDNARFNYEFVRRQLEEQDDGQQDPQDQGDQQQDQNQQGEGQDGQQDQQSDSDQPQHSEGDPQEQDGEQQPQDGDQPPQRDEGESDQQGEQEQDEAQEPGAAQPDTQRLSPEEAERILQALEADEAELLREVQRMDARPRRVEKDW